MRIARAETVLINGCAFVSALATVALFGALVFVVWKVWGS